MKKAYVKGYHITRIKIILVLSEEIGYCADCACHVNIGGKRVRERERERKKKKRERESEV